MAPRTAVIVLTLNAHDFMPALLTAIAAVSISPRHVVFVDSSSDDDTAEIARAAGHTLHRIRRCDFGHGRTRNEAARLCSDCDFLVYLTQDACPQGTDWLQRLLEPFADPEVALVYGRQLPRPEAGASERYAREFNYPALPDRSTRADLSRRGVKAVFCSNSFAAYRREALDAVGGFPERLPMGEDMAAALRLLERGYARVYAPTARAVHSHDYRIGDEFKRYFDIGALMAIDPGLRRVSLAASGEGWRFLRGELTAAWHLSGPLGVGCVALRASAKYIGFLLGQRHAVLPRAWRPRMSLHSFFWNR
jgi:rhamnosyltransferase